MFLPVYRRQFGLVLGMVTGFAAGLVFQGINHLLMPGTPLYQPPFGALINTLLCMAAGGLLGLLTAWPDVSVKGILLGSFLATLIILAVTLVTGQTDSTAISQKSFVLMFILVPLMGLMAPVLVFFRWIVSREEMSVIEAKAGFQTSHISRLIMPILLILLAGLLGLTGVQPKMARAVLPTMHTLIQSGQMAQRIEMLPEPLKSQDVMKFLEQGRGKYELEWQKDEQNQYLIKRPLAPLDQQSIVIAHYENGYVLICRFPGETGPPNCKDF